jgi:ubiquinone/menaquinone biosynthesis C-methylase UbiE
MSIEPHWGGAAVDLAAWDLPALKLSFLVQHAPRRGKLLELGSGEGKVLRTIARERPELTLLGCDVRDVPCSDGSFEFRRMEAGRLPAADAELDAVVLADVLEHVPEPEGVLDEVRRVLKPGGSLLGFVPLEGERVSAYTLYRNLLGADLYRETKHHLHAFRRRQVQVWLEQRFTLLEQRFAYHLLGQTMDASFFAAARLPRLSRFWWTENRYYHSEAPAREPLPRLLNGLLQVGNRLAFAESRLLARVAWLSAGLLFSARRA